MAKWVKITSPQDKRVPENTLGEVKEEDKDYYYIYHWANSSRIIKELKTNCEDYTSLIGNKVTYNNENYKIIGYAMDYPTGMNTIVPLTGKRVVLEALKPTTVFDKGKDVYITTKYSNVS
jgi:hypothetical protein